MDLIARIADVIIPVFLIVAIGYGHARRRALDMTAFNRIALDVLAPMLVYTALAARDFVIAKHLALLVGGAVIVLGGGLLAWPLGLEGVARGQLLLLPPCRRP
jgi:malate permease and related proteins